MDTDTFIGTIGNTLPTNLREMVITIQYTQELVTSLLQKQTSSLRLIFI